MAETTETPDVGVSDSELFSNATAPEPKPEAPPPHPEVEGRDIHGRFRKAEEQTPTPPGEPPAPPPQPTPQPGQPPAPGVPPQQPQQEDANVPSWRLREEREQRETLARQLQERDHLLRQMQQRMEQYERPQAPAELPDPLIDPQGYRQALEGKFTSDLRTVQLENNLQLNRLQHGEVFDHAYQAFMQAAQGDPGFARLIVNSPNPGSAMVNWYRRAVTLAKVGDDPDKYVEQEIARRLADPQFLSRAVEAARSYASGQPLPAGNGAAPPRQNNVTQIPPSLSRVPSGSPTEYSPGAGGMPSDEELFSESLPPVRKRR